MLRALHNPKGLLVYDLLLMALDYFVSAFLVVLRPLTYKIFHFLIHLLEMGLIQIESMSFSLYEFITRYIGRKPCRTYPAMNSAIVVVGGEDGVGPSITMRFSELGYTVFVLCSNHALNIPQSPSGGYSDVSSRLLYTWHHKKERSPHTVWGLVAPISLDTSSKSSRAHAHETVKAYCTHHSLHMAALIILPSPIDSSIRRASTQIKQTSLSTNSDATSYRFLPLCISKEDVLKERIAQEAVEPILVVGDYIHMLNESSGRVIVVSGCSESSFASESIREAVCRTLRREFDPLGIWVSSICSGPIETSPVASAVELDRRNINLKLANLDVLHPLRRELGIQHAIRKVLRPYAVRENHIFSVILRIVESKYPKPNHLIGIHPIIFGLWSLSPQLLRRIIHFVL